MRISDEERREVAHELREMVGARCYGRPGETGSCVDIDDFLTALLDRRVRDCEVSIDSVEALRVADLIDRPTCKNSEYLYDGSFFECSRCGERWELTCGSPADNNLNFCPRCGAEVVS